MDTNGILVPVVIAIGLVYGFFFFKRKFSKSTSRESLATWVSRLLGLVPGVVLILERGQRPVFEQVTIIALAYFAASMAAGLSYFYLGQKMINDEKEAGRFMPDDESEHKKNMDSWSKAYAWMGVLLFAVALIFGGYNWVGVVIYGLVMGYFLAKTIAAQDARDVVEKIIKNPVDKKATA